jgi:autotransporter passenger strand-loop-strand repeat protein
VLVQSGHVFISALSGTVTGVVVNADKAFVLSGGVAIDTVMENEGLETVYSGGVASGTIGNGDLDVLAGGSAVGVSLGIGDVERVQSGGFASGTVINQAAQGVGSGGIASNTTVGGVLSQSQEFGNQTVLSGGVANGTVVNAGGYIIVSAGAQVNDLVINSGGGITLPYVNFDEFNNGGAATVNSGSDVLAITAFHLTAVFSVTRCDSRGPTRDWFGPAIRFLRESMCHPVRP